MNAVILFKWQWTVASVLIKLITRDKYTHAAILRSGEIFDASEKRGNVGKGKPLSSYKNRKVVVYRVPSPGPEVDTWIQESLGTEYDWHGVLAWVFKYVDPEKYFCFTYALAYINLCVGHPQDIKHKTSARDVSHKVRDRKVFEGSAADAAKKFNLE